MSNTLHFGLSFDALSVAFDVPLEGIEDAIDRLTDRANEAREAEEEGFGGPGALVIYVQCPHCGADATCLGSTDLDYGKARFCMRCRSMFGVV
jgi:hypothetical protein